MNTRRKLFFDRLIGYPIGLLLNVFAKILGAILYINHSLEKDFKVIALCKFLGMGSIIQTTPLLQTLRKKYPDTRLVFITVESNQNLLQLLSIVDEVICVNDKSFLPLITSSVRSIMRLWKLRPGVYIDLEVHSNYSSVFTTLSCAKNRFGFYKSEKQYRLGMYTHMMYFNMKAPVAEVYLQFARLLKCDNEVHTLIAPALNNDIAQTVSEKLAKHAITNTYFAINPNASDLRIERRWSKQSFAGLINNLHREFPNQYFILIGNKDERSYVDEIIALTSDHSRALNMAGLLSLAELTELLRKTELVITNDTGPMHFSFALNKKTVALFGPGNPSHYGNNHNSFVVYKNVYCSPCVYEFVFPPCNGDNQCMKKITVEEVVEIIKVALSNSTLLQEQPESTIDYLDSKKFPLGIVSRH